MYGVTTKERIVLLELKTMWSRSLVFGCCITGWRETEFPSFRAFQCYNNAITFLGHSLPLFVFYRVFSSTRFGRASKPKFPSIATKVFKNGLNLVCMFQWNWSAEGQSAGIINDPMRVFHGQFLRDFACARRRIHPKENWVEPAEATEKNHSSEPHSGWIPGGDSWP